MPVANVRVFLVTYRRPELLRRALASLLAQTHADWFCELHNDDPDDERPARILREMAPDDRRFSYHRHEQNWGATRVFNHAFAGGPEPFAALLEDDNWWESAFLGTALQALGEHPEASLAWANMRIWCEQPDGTWHDTGRNIWPEATPDRRILFHPPEIIQAFDALHSNGAMVFRPRRFRVQAVPEAMPFAIIETARERAAAGPLLLMPQVLANFAATLATTRSADPSAWMQAKLLSAGSFLDRVEVPDAVLRRIWDTRKAQRPRDTDVFFHLALSLRKPALLRFATPDDWIRFLAGAARHPRRLHRALRFRQDNPAAWSWLVAQTTHWAGTATASVVRKTDPLPQAP